MKNTKKIIFAAIFVVLMVVGAYIKIPLPFVSFTLQTLFVILSGVCLGSKWGAFSMLAYVTAGLIGLPFFSTGSGFGYVLNPTFGYLLGFISGAFAAGLVIEKRKNRNFKTVLIAGIVCVAFIYIIGVPYLAAVLKFVTKKNGAIKYALTAGFIVTVPADIVKIVLAAFICTKLPDMCFPSLNSKDF